MERVYRDCGGEPGRDRGHNPCPLCGSSDAFSFFDGDAGPAWHCHKCGAGGNALRLLMLAKGLDSTAARKLLEERYGAPARAAPARPVKRGRTYPDAPSAEAAVGEILARDGYRYMTSWTYEARSKKGAWLPAI